MKATCQVYATRFVQMLKDAVAFPSNGCKIVYILLGKAELCTTRCEAAKVRRQCFDKQVTKAYVDGNVLVEAMCQSDHGLQLQLTMCMK